MNKFYLPVRYYDSRKKTHYESMIGCSLQNARLGIEPLKQCEKRVNDPASTDFDCVPSEDFDSTIGSLGDLSSTPKIIWLQKQLILFSPSCSANLLTWRRSQKYA